MIALKYSADLMANRPGTAPRPAGAKVVRHPASRELPESNEAIWLNLGEARICLRRSLDDLGLQLSPREKQILLLTAQGEGVKSIARTLEISVHTVDTFRRRIYQKLGVSNAASAAAITIALCLGAEIELDATR